MATAREHPAARGAPYRDGKRYLWLLSSLYPLYPAGFVALAYVTGHAGWLWGLPLLFYGLVPLLDQLLPEDRNNPPDADLRRVESDRYYRILVYLAVPGHFITLLAGAWAFARGDFPAWGLAGLTVSVGIVSGLAINTGHELGHKKTALERWLARIVLAVPAYGHFYVEHNKGHHRHVSTPLDPASARMGESLYGFALLREIPGAARRAWELERARLARAGRGPWSLDNEVVRTSAMSLVLYGAILAVFGWIVLPFLLAQAAIAWFHLSLANYVEHYGLLRQKAGDGRYERCRPEHSWNTNHVVSNLILFHLQRHSDHHANPTRRYQALRHFEGLPALPGGYPAMWLAALVPPVWRRIMDPRLLRHYDYDLTRVNVAPDKRDALFARYHRPTSAAAEAGPG